MRLSSSHLPPFALLGILLFSLISSRAMGVGRTGVLDLVAQTPASEPLNADVIIDGEAQDKQTPATFGVKPGKHHVVVSYGVRRWEGHILVHPDRPTKKLITLSDRIASSAYSIGVAIGGGAVQYLASGGDLPATVAGSASLDFRHKAWPLTLMVRTSYVAEEKYSGYTSGPNSAPYHRTISSASLTLIPTFYFALVRQSAPNGQSFSVPRDAEKFLAGFLALRFGTSLNIYTTTFDTGSGTTQSNEVIFPMGLEFGMYAQSLHWTGRFGLYAAVDPFSAGNVAGKVRGSEGEQGIYIELGYVFGIGGPEEVEHR